MSHFEFQISTSVLMVRVTGLEPDNTLFYMFFLVLICAKMQKTSRLFLIVIRLNMAYIFL